MEKIKVSICCITYNQENYIEDAIKSFLMQKTNFKYEIIIRDDASTDKTAEIIRKYEEKYPDIIKPIYEKVNGILSGVKRIANITFDKAKGKYIAFCEGDDYWCDVNKLQRQYDYMEQNKDCALYIHNANKLNVKNNKLKAYNNKKDFYFIDNKKDFNFNAGQMLLIGLSANFATASMFFKRDDINDLPQFYYDAPCGDMPLKFILANKGYVHYENKIMSIYRYNRGTSIMDSWFTQSDEKKIGLNEKFKDLIDKFDAYSENKFEKEFKLIKSGYDVDTLLIKRKYKDILKNSEYRKIYKNIHSDYFFIKMFIKKYFPMVINYIYKMRGRK